MVAQGGDALLPREWALPPECCAVLQLSALNGDISSLIRQFSLPALQATLQCPDLWTEFALLQRLIYKNTSQHRSSTFMRQLRAVSRQLSLLQALQLPQCLGDLHAMTQLLPNNTKGGPAGGAQGFQRQTVRVPCQEAVLAVLQRLRAAGALGHGLATALLAAAEQLTGQAARSFFMPLSLTGLAMLARIQVLASHFLSCCTSTYNSLSGLLPLLPCATPPSSPAAQLHASALAAAPEMLRCTWLHGVPHMRALEPPPTGQQPAPPGPTQHPRSRGWVAVAAERAWEELGLMQGVEVVWLALSQSQSQGQGQGQGASEGQGRDSGLAEPQAAQQPSVARQSLQHPVATTTVTATPPLAPTLQPFAQPAVGKGAQPAAAAAAVAVAVAASARPGGGGLQSTAAAAAAPLPGRKQGLGVDQQSSRSSSARPAAVGGSRGERGGPAAGLSGSKRGRASFFDLLTGARPPPGASGGGAAAGVQPPPQALAPQLPAYSAAASPAFSLGLDRSRPGRQPGAMAGAGAGAGGARGGVGAGAGAAGGPGAAAAPLVKPAGAAEEDATAPLAAHTDSSAASLGTNESALGAPAAPAAPTADVAAAGGQAPARTGLQPVLPAKPHSAPAFVRVGAAPSHGAGGQPGKAAGQQQQAAAAGKRPGDAAPQPSAPARAVDQVVQQRADKASLGLGPGAAAPAPASSPPVTTTAQASPSSLGAGPGAGTGAGVGPPLLHLDAAKRKRRLSSRAAAQASPEPGAARAMAEASPAQLARPAWADLLPASRQ